MSGSSGNQGTPSVCPSPRIPSDMGSGHIHLKLNESRDKRSSLHVDEVTKNNVVTMVRFAMALMENLELDMNKRKYHKSDQHHEPRPTNQPSRLLASQARLCAAVAV